VDTKILLVDDEARILHTFARTLRMAGYTVITAASGQEGMELYWQEAPDIVMLDLRMPGMDGLAALQAIRQHDPEANVILCTAHGDKDQVIAALRAGASDFLPKPIDQVALESALRRAEERIHLKRELRASKEALERYNERLEEEVRARTAELEREIEDRKQAEEALARQEAELRATLYGIGDAIISTDIEGRVKRMNPVAEQLTGWAEAEAVGLPLPEVFQIVDEETLRPVDNLVTQVLRAGKRVGLSNSNLLISRDGREIPISDSAAPVFDLEDRVGGVALVFRDQTEERLNRHMTEVRLSLIEYAANHTLDELLTRALDEIGALVDSPIGFYHFLGPDQKTLSLQQWSTRTREEFCRAEGKGMHYAVDEAGVWVDCVHQKRPVIHNDYASLPHRKGLPEGHAPVVRELVVPVMREDKVVAILGVGNKPVDYTQKDVEIVSFLADVTWEIVRQKRTEEALQERMKELTCLYAISRDMQRGLSVEELCRRAVGHLVPAMQFPEITVPVIELGGEQFTSERYVEGMSPGLHAEIRGGGQIRGWVRVYYVEEKPFLLPEEQNLINGVAEALSTWLEREPPRITRCVPVCE
jgi:PAS domain S-box-containing protein